MSAGTDVGARTGVEPGAKGRVLLINPKITTRRHARFPLSIMTIAAALEDSHDSMLIDGNVDGAAVRAACDAARTQRFDAVGVTVMGGPQVATAIEVSRALRAAQPDLPIVWGGYFPTLYPSVALNNDYVDFVVRGQGEDTFVDLMEALARPGREKLAAVDGLSWRSDGVVQHNPERAFTRKHIAPTLRYDRLPDAKTYLAKTFLGQRTAGHQAALGCRFRCTFCGVAAMFRGATALPPAERLDREIAYLKQLGADSIQFYDHNFFDREEDMVPLLEVLARHEVPWWCYARADALVNLSPETWRLVRKSRLRMAYIGAETPNDRLLKSIRKGTRSEQTLEVAEVCRANGVIPELSFMVAPPEDPEGETEAHVRFHSPRQARESVGGDHRLRLHAVAGRQRPRLAAVEARAAARRARRARRVSENPRGMDGAPLGRLCLSRRRTLAQRSAAATHPRFRNRVAMPVPDRTRHALSGLGQGSAARSRELALCAAPLRSPVGAHGVAEPHRSARSARHEPLSCGALPLHVVQISFFVDPQRRAPETLLRDWIPLVDVAAAVASAGERITVVQASMVHGHDRAIRRHVSFRGTGSRRRAARAQSRVSRAATRARSRTCFMSMASASGSEVRELHELAPSTPILLQDHADRGTALLASQCVAERRDRRKRHVVLRARAGRAVSARSPAAAGRRDFRDPRIDELVRSRRHSRRARRYGPARRPRDPVGRATSTRTRIR